MKRQTRQLKERRQASARVEPGLTSPQTAAAAAESLEANINPKWTWHYRGLLALRDRFLTQCAARRREVAEPLEAHSLSLADSASDEYDHDLALAELAAERDELFEVDAAINRILKGTYGVCEESGQRISPSRLRAVPWTRFAQAAQQRLEAQAAKRRTGLAPPSSLKETFAGTWDESEVAEENE